VTGAAPYPSDVTYSGLVHAALVQSTIAAGTISRIDAGDAEAAPGVLAVITYENAPALAEGPTTPLLGPTPRFPLKDNRILHHGQHVTDDPGAATSITRTIKVVAKRSAARTRG
jgi:xanthine dehydrogenase YagR molybdenum-binding subunit